MEIIEAHFLKEIPAAAEREEEIARRAELERLHSIAAAEREHWHAELASRAELAYHAELEKRVARARTAAVPAPSPAASVVEVPRSRSLAAPAAAAATAAPVTFAATARTNSLVEVTALEQIIVDGSLLFGCVDDEEKFNDNDDAASIASWNSSCSSSGARSPVAASAPACSTPVLHDASPGSSRGHMCVASREPGSANVLRVASDPLRQQSCRIHESLHDFVRRKGPLSEQQARDFLQQIVARIRTLPNSKRRVSETQHLPHPSVCMLS
jgi:hypothetical protein